MYREREDIRMCIRMDGVGGSWVGLGCLYDWKAREVMRVGRL
jgi:hypothetical protein